MVATTSPSHRCGAPRAWVDQRTNGCANIASASTAPQIAPAICAGR